MKKNIFNSIIILISVVMIFTFIFNTQGIELLSQQIKTLNPFWIFIAILCMFLYWGFEAMALNAITSFQRVNSGLSESFTVTMVGQYFNSITPFATGGQPAQILYLMKNKVDTGKASFIVMMKFFVFQLVLIIYSLIIIVFTYSNFESRIPFLMSLTILGLIVHASMIIITILFAYNRTLTEKFLKTIFKLLKKIKIVKGNESAEQKLEDELSIFHGNAVLLRNNPKLLLKTSLLVFIQLTFFFSIPYFIARSFGFKNVSFVNLFAGAVFIATIISVIPLPGAVGGAEGGFLLFFKPFFLSNTLFTAMLIWRIITFYSCIGLGGIYTVLLPKRGFIIKKIKLIGYKKKRNFGDN
jgi:glycosyltransferase 2 family protein